MPDTSRLSSRSRRSYPNLSNLSLAPLSAKYTLDGASSPPDTDRIRTSYIAQKSAPTTPGILSLSQSRSNSRNGRRVKAVYAYDGSFHDPDRHVRDVGDIPKAKSTTALLHAGVSFADEPHARHHTRKSTAPLLSRTTLVRHHTTDADDEWWHRAGLAIAGESRDAKGQGWLVRRESATSLVQEEYEERGMALLSGEHLGAEDFPTWSPRMSKMGSRAHSRMQSQIQSRVPSARQSRRGSRAGSRVDLAMTAGSTVQELDLLSFDVEPDFIHSDDESGAEADEEEVARLARERGFGLGGWVDKLVGWTLFSVDEDRESSDDDVEEEEDRKSFRPENMTQEELRLRREVEAKRRKLERESIIAASALRGQGDSTQNDETQRPPEDAGGWQDAAWLLSVASKALF